MPRRVLNLAVVSRIVSRLPAALLLLALVVQGTGLDLTLLGGCESSACSGYDTEDCSCERCLCCSHHRHVTLTPGLSEQPRELAALDVLRVAEPAPSADPNEIMHVPRPVSVRQSTARLIVASPERGCRRWVEHNTCFRGSS